MDYQPDIQFIENEIAVKCARIPECMEILLADSRVKIDVSVTIKMIFEQQDPEFYMLGMMSTLLVQDKYEIPDEDLFWALDQAKERKFARLVNMINKRRGIFHFILGLFF